MAIDTPLTESRIIALLSGEFPDCGFSYNAERQDFAMHLSPSMAGSQIDGYRERFRQRLKELREQIANEPEPAGYRISLPTGEYGTLEEEPQCLTCIGDGPIMWPLTPITREQAEQEAIKCGECDTLLVVDFLQRQIDEQGRLLRDWYAITEYGRVDCTDFAGHEDYQALKQIKEKTAPFYYKYVETKRGY